MWISLGSDAPPNNILSSRRGDEGMSFREFLKKIVFKDWNDVINITSPFKGRNIELDSKQEHNYSPVNGTVCVKDGRIEVCDPKHYGSYPTIVVPDDPYIKVTVNGEPVTGQVVVSESHDIQVELIGKEPYVTYECIVSEDELSVSVKATIVPGFKLRLRDCAPSETLVLSVEKEFYSPEETSPITILKLLSDHGYEGTVDHEAIQRICKYESTEEVVLRGIKPRGSGGFTCKFVRIPVETDPILQTKRCGRVSIGTILGMVERGIGDIPGRNVYGKEIPVDPQEFTLSLGAGVIHVNNHLVAARDGRVFLTKDRIDVVRELVVEQDITDSEDEIVFDGNVVVQGSVEKGASIKATGLVTIYGSVRQSTIMGDRGVIVLGEVNKSKVFAGYQVLLYRNLLSIIERTLGELDRFRSEYLTLIQHALKRADAAEIIPKIPSILFSKRHVELIRLLTVFVKEYAEVALIDNHYRLMKELIESKWLS
ncbi:FapA family protein [Alicyclobacillus acidocaldarius]|uniref:FapA family protein n=1 Tax=Alicyclobacillus acidocaldarius TaxID=405212 RepID=UPI001C54DAB8|nr:FapA family protein [Alicyclobacillus acidocaldarius]